MIFLGPKGDHPLPALASAGVRSPPAAPYGWLEERLEAQAVADDLASKFVPPHVNLFYCFGGLALAALLLQFASGGALTAYFRPAVLDSLAGELGARLDYGWFPRGLHRVSSSFVLFFTLLHASRVFFTGGQLRPRELTWLSGLSLAPLGSAFGVSGYTLPWDSAGPWALQVVSAIPAPLDLYRAGAGTLAVQALRGGPALGQPSLSRCFLAHTLLLPFFILPALALHLALVRKAGVSGPLQLHEKNSVFRVFSSPPLASAPGGLEEELEVGDLAGRLADRVGSRGLGRVLKVYAAAVDGGEVGEPGRREAERAGVPAE